MDATITTLLRLEGRRLLSPDGAELAILGDDEAWRTPDGCRCESVAIASPRAVAQVDPAERRRADRVVDQAWIAGAVDAIRQIVQRQAKMTGDDVWEHVSMPPREARMIGNALVAAQAAGLITPTDEHVASRRAMNHRRPVRVWARTPVSNTTTQGGLNA